MSLQSLAWWQSSCLSFLRQVCTTTCLQLLLDSDRLGKVGEVGSVLGHPWLHSKFGTTLGCIKPCFKNSTAKSHCRCASTDAYTVPGRWVLVIPSVPTRLGLVMWVLVLVPPLSPGRRSPSHTLKALSPGPCCWRLCPQGTPAVVMGEGLPGPSVCGSSAQHSRERVSPGSRQLRLR